MSSDLPEQPQSRNGSPSAFLVMENKDVPGDLYFWTRDDWHGDVPTDQAQLREEFDSACGVLRGRLMKRDAVRFREAFGQLLDTARATFAGEYAQVESGRSALNGFKSRLVLREGADIKDEYLKQLVAAAFYASLLILAIAISLRIGLKICEDNDWVVVTKSQDGKTTEAALQSVRWDAHFGIIHTAVLLSASMWGVWLSFFVRNVKWQFEQLEHPESDLARPWSRLLATGLLTLILALFFQMQVIVISVGGISTSQICDDMMVALFVGLGLGFLNETLPDEVHRRLKEFFQQAKSGSETA